MRYKFFLKNNFTFIEIIISFIILTITALFILHMLNVGRLFIKTVDNKILALRVATEKINNYLSNSYEGLTPGNFSGIEGNFIWEANITENTSSVPHKFIEVKVKYPESIFQQKKEKELRLVNLLLSQFFEVFNYYNNTEKTINFDYQNFLKITLGPYLLDKTIIIVYNIRIKIDNSTGIGSLDTILSRVLLEKEIIYPETRTPIATQPFINNFIVFDISKNTSKELILQLRKDTNAGNIKVMEVSLIAEIFNK